MSLNTHSPTPFVGLKKYPRDFVGKHAFLSPSSPAWINYTDEKLDRVYFTNEASRRGTELHEFAKKAIELGITLPDTNKTLNLYVNDCIGHRLTPEQTLVYSANCFGTADACGFRNNTLRIFDLKTGVNEASFTQLFAYVAIFCLEYRMRPFDIEIETRIYQNDDVRVEIPDPGDITQIMETIKHFDKRLNYLKEEAL